MILDQTASGMAIRKKMEEIIPAYLDGIRLVHGAATVPIYGSWEFYFGNGIVGGVMTSAFIQGRQAAGLAKKY